MQQLTIDPDFMYGLRALCPMSHSHRAEELGIGFYTPSPIEWRHAASAYHGASMVAPYESDAYIFARYLSETADAMRRYAQQSTLPPCDVCAPNMFPMCYQGGICVCAAGTVKQ